MPTARDWETRVAGRIDPGELVELTRQAVRFESVNPPGETRQHQNDTQNDEQSGSRVDNEIRVRAEPGP